MFAGVTPVLIFMMMSFDAVEMVKQLSDKGLRACYSLAFHGDVVYIGRGSCILQWNVVADTVSMLIGCPGLIFEAISLPFQFHVF